MSRHLSSSQHHHSVGTNTLNKNKDDHTRAAVALNNTAVHLLEKQGSVQDAFSILKDGVKVMKGCFRADVIAPSGDQQEEALEQQRTQSNFLHSAMQRARERVATFAHLPSRGGMSSTENEQVRAVKVLNHQDPASVLATFDNCNSNAESCKGTSSQSTRDVMMVPNKVLYVSIDAVDSSSSDTWAETSDVICAILLYNYTMAYHQIAARELILSNGLLEQNLEATRMLKLQKEVLQLLQRVESTIIPRLLCAEEVEYMCPAPVLLLAAMTYHAMIEVAKKIGCTAVEIQYYMDRFHYFSTYIKAIHSILPPTREGAAATA